MENNRIIFHIDVNNAFVSFESVYRLQMGSDIDYRTVPCVVSGCQATRHGIILAKSYPAKKFGIQTAMPTVEALRLCPKLIVLPANYYLYMACHKSLMEILRLYSDKVQVFSIDEAFLDYTGMERIFGEPIKAADEIRERIFHELGFTVNIGISTNKLLAKMAGELDKPFKTITCFPNEIEKKLWGLPVSDLYMCGKQTAPKLHSIGIYTIGDLAHADLEWVKYKLKSWGIMLYNYSHGIEESPVNMGSSHSHIIKGVGNSATSHFDILDKEDSYLLILSLVETVASRLRFGGFCSRVIAISLKKAEGLTSSSHQKKLITPIDSTLAIYEVCKQLFDEMWKGEPLRHIGIRCSDLCTGDYIQLSFFERDWGKQKPIDLAIDNIRMKYGSRSIHRSCFLWKRVSPVQGMGMTTEELPIMTSIL